jgi:Tol biopolymer transport system component
LSPSPAFDVFSSLIWAPDGRSLIASCRDVKGRNAIFAVDPQTGRASILVEQKEGEGIPRATGISPDGTKLYYAAANSPSIRFSFEKDLTTGRVKELHRGPRTWTNGNLSPDGRHLLVSDPSNPGWLVILPTAEGEIRKIALENGGRGLGWAPDGSAIYRIMQSGDIWRLPVDGSEPRKLDSKLEPDGPGLGLFRIHPDGQQIAFETATAPKPQEVWVLENFMPTLAANK